MTAVSVITATWQRHAMLLDRCVPSVQAQDHPGTEHIIVSDGPDPELHKALLDQMSESARRGALAHETWLYELPVHGEAKHWGAPARLAGLGYASGDYLAYCDDDDQLRPEHCRLLAAALDAAPDAGFAVSRMMQHTPFGEQLIGAGPLALGNVGTPMIMHRRSVLETAAWGEPSEFEDWNLTWAWLRAGISYVRVDEITADAHPSVFR
jgi:glycosyltransferase involved in cell wall biosynthesis